MTERLFKQKRPPKIMTSRQFRLTLLSVFLLILLLILVIYHEFQAILLDALKDQNANFAAQVSATAGFAEETMQNVANQVFYSQSVSKLRTYESLTNAQVISGIRELNSFCASSTIIDSIYVYNGKQNYIYSTNTFGAVNSAFDTFADSVATELFAERAPQHRMEMLPRYAYAANDYSDRTIYSFLFYKLDTEGKPEDNAILFNVNALWFTKLYFGNRSGHAFIIDGAGKLVAEQDDSEETESLTERVRSRLEAGEKNGYFLYPTAQGKMACFFSDMEKHGWCYVLSMDYRDCLNGLDRVEQRTLLFLTLGFIVLCVAGISISLHLYLPFQKVAARLSVFEPNVSNDTEKLLGSLNRLIENTSNIESFRRSVQGIIRDETMKKLLLGQLQKDEWSRLCGECRFSIEPDVPTVLCLISGLHLSQYLERFRQSAACCEGVEIQNDYTIVFLQNISEDALWKTMEDQCALHPTTYFIIGRTLSHWRDIPSSYERLLEARRLLFLNPNRHLIFLEERDELDSSTVLLDERAESIVAALKKGSYSKGLEEWRKFTAALNGKSYSAVRYALLSLGKAVCRLEYPLTTEREKYEAVYKDYQQKLDRLKDIQVLEHFFEQLFLQITQQVRQEQVSRRGSLISDVIAALEDSYNNPQLTSQSLADRFGLSAVYLSRIFKRETGISLMDYVNQLRIAQAQKILSDPSVKIKDVPQRIGIENKQYFFKLFKDITGKTPKQFQSEHRG